MLLRARVKKCGSSVHGWDNVWHGLPKLMVIGGCRQLC